MGWSRIQWKRGLSEIFKTILLLICVVILEIITGLSHHGDPANKNNCSFFDLHGNGLIKINNNNLPTGLYTHFVDKKIGGNYDIVAQLFNG